ncbi:MAG: DUF1259 domain-containing protein [Deltaproteobacteria bacterium]|nr:DUF1259 domain-containing protein [Deltaproteobacteria bacterium]
MTKPFAFVGLISVFLMPGAWAATPQIDAAKIEEITGLKGKLNEKEATFKVSQPRADVKIAVDGWTMPPFMGLTTWAAFTKGRKSDLMVMGDLVLFQDEVNPVMSALFENGIDVTALHNHFFYEDPKVYFMHISGEGTSEKLAHGVRAALDKVKQIREASSTPSKSFGLSDLPGKSSITGKPIEEIIGQPGDAKDGMFKVTIGRNAKMACGCNAGKDMGVNTWAAFAGSDDNALVDGDFAVLEDELQPVLRSLRKSNVNIVAIHSHMTGEKPRTLFLHYWGRGKSTELAQAVKAALAVQTKGKTK